MLIIISTDILVNKKKEKKRKKQTHLQMTLNLKLFALRVYPLFQMEYISRKQIQTGISNILRLTYKS